MCPTLHKQVAVDIHRYIAHAHIVYDMYIYRGSRCLQMRLTIEFSLRSFLNLTQIKCGFLTGYEPGLTL